MGSNQNLSDQNEGEMRQIGIPADLHRNPRTIKLIDELSHHGRAATLSRSLVAHIATGALIAVWSAAITEGKRQGRDLVCRSLTPAVIDTLVEWPGFAAALMVAGWIEQTPEDVVFIRFFEHCSGGDDARIRTANAERQRRYRERHRNKSEEVTTTTEPELIQMEIEIPPQPAPAASTKSPAEADPLFAKFWAAYPRKTDKLKAAKAWAKLTPDELLLQRMLEAIATQKQSEQWLRDGGQYIPHPTTWLNGRRWEDEIIAGSPQPQPQKKSGFKSKGEAQSDFINDIFNEAFETGE